MDGVVPREWRCVGRFSSEQCRSWLIAAAEYTGTFESCAFAAASAVAGAVTKRTNDAAQLLATAAKHCTVGGSAERVRTSTVLLIKHWRSISAPRPIEWKWLQLDYSDRLDLRHAERPALHLQSLCMDTTDLGRKILPVW